MAKHVACLVGWHKWRVRSTEDGTRFRQCVRCLKEDSGVKMSPDAGWLGGGDR